MKTVTTDRSRPLRDEPKTGPGTGSIFRRGEDEMRFRAGARQRPRLHGVPVLYARTQKVQLAPARTMAQAEAANEAYGNASGEG